MEFKQLFIATIAVVVMSSSVFSANLPKGTADDPLRVMMLPADTGGADVAEDCDALVISEFRRNTTGDQLIKMHKISG